MQTPRDENRIPTIIGVLNSDGVTPVSIWADPTSHKLKADNGTTGTDNGPTQAVRDENRVTGLMATSSSDGVTPVALYADSLHNLLIKST